MLFRSKFLSKLASRHSGSHMEERAGNVTGSVLREWISPPICRWLIFVSQGIRSKILEPVNSAFYEKRVIASMIELWMVRLSGWALNVITSILIREAEGDSLNVQRRRWCGDWGRHWYEAATSHVVLAATRSWNSKGLPSPLGPPERGWPGWYLDFASVMLILDF